MPAVAHAEGRPLATLEKHLQVCERANLAYKRNVEMMKKKYCKKRKVVKFNVGDYVSARIPRADRASTDLQRFPCLVIGIVGKTQELYRLRCRDGVLKSCLLASELEVFAGTFKSEEWGDNMITLREAAKLQTPWNTFTTNICNCNGGCLTRRCSCRKKGTDCSTHCHHGKCCTNKK